MATFKTFAKAVSPEDPDSKAFAAGVIKSPPGNPLRDFLERTGGKYEYVLLLSPRFREEIRRVAELTSDARLLDIVERGQVTIPFEHLRGLDPETPITFGCTLSYSQSERERLGLMQKGPFDPRKGVFLDSNPVTDLTGD